MAKKARNEALVGLVVVVALLLTVYIVVILGDWSNMIARKQDITVRLPYQEGLKGLAAGSVVSLGGVKVGEVVATDIAAPGMELAEEGAFYVSFTMRLPEVYPIRQDCQLTAASGMLGGQATLEIHDLGSEGEPLANGAILTKEGLDGGLGDVMDNLRAEFNVHDPCSLLSRIRFEFDRNESEALLAHLVKTSAYAEAISAELHEEFLLTDDGSSLRSRLHALLINANDGIVAAKTQLDAGNKDAAVAKLNIALEQVNEVLTKVDTLVAENSRPITNTIASTERIAGTLEERMPSLLDQLQTALDSANTALTEARSLMTDGRQMLAANRETVDRIVQDVHEVSVNLSAVSREVRRAPWKLLYRPGEQEVDTQALMDSADNFVAGAERLDDLAIRLRALLAVPAEERTDVDEERIRKMMAQLEETFEKFKEAEQEFWNRL